MKATEQYVPEVLFIILYKAVLTFESVGKVLQFDHLSYWAVLSCATVHYAIQGGSNFSWVCGWNPIVWPFKWKLLSSTFLWCCLLYCTRWFWLLSLWMKSYSVTIHMKAILFFHRPKSQAWFPYVQTDRWKKFSYRSDHIRQQKKNTTISCK